MARQCTGSCLDGRPVWKIVQGRRGVQRGDGAADGLGGRPHAAIAPGRPLTVATVDADKFKSMDPLE